MDSTIQVDPFQDQLNHVVVAVADLMARAMDQEFQYLVHQVGIERFSVKNAAETANRIVVLCRRLVEDVRRYERYERWRREEDAQITASQPDDDEIDL
jgi:hypothetical protein